MISNDKRIRIIIGHYGSGKSEFAMNYVTKLREEIDSSNNTLICFSFIGSRSR